MKNTFALVKRNCLLFLRSKQTVFFSFFSGLIIIVLYFLFIANLYSQGFNEVAGLELTQNQLNFAIYSQMIMGVLVINSVSLSVGMFTVVARDLETRKTDAFMMTNLKPFELMLSYLISALLVSFALNALMLLLSVIVIGIVTSFWLSAATFFALFGVLALVTVISCAIMLLITTLVRSSQALGVINGILGTVIGFLCGIYMPYTNMGEGVVYIGSLLPFTHMTVWLKQIALGDVFGQFGFSEELTSKMQEMWFSAGNVGFVGLDVPLWGMILISVGVAIICMAIAVLLFRRTLLNRRRAPKIKKMKQNKFVSKSKGE